MRASRQRLLLGTAVTGTAVAVGTLLIVANLGAASAAAVTTTSLTSTTLPSAVASAVATLDEGMKPVSSVEETDFPGGTVPETNQPVGMWSWTSSSGRLIEADGVPGDPPGLAGCGTTADVQVCHGIADGQGTSGQLYGVKDAGISTISVAIGSSTTQASLSAEAASPSGWILSWSNGTGSTTTPVTVTISDTSGASATATVADGDVTTASSGLSAYVPAATAVAAAVSDGIGMSLPPAP